MKVKQSANAIGQQKLRVAQSMRASIASVGRGQLAMMSVGSYGAGVLPQILNAANAAGTSAIIGPILLLEPDQHVLDQCLQAIPPIFRSRLVIAQLQNYPSGLYSASVDEVERQRESWERPVREATALWATRVKGESENGLLLTLISPGGSTALGVDAIEVYRNEWPWKKVYGATAIDHRTPVRVRFGEILNTYEPLLDGCIVCDNRRNHRAADRGLGLLVAATPAARLVEHRPVELWNAWPNICATTKFAMISTWATALPVTWERSLFAGVPITRRHFVEEGAKSGIHAVVDDPLLQSVPLPAKPAPSHSRLVLVASPLVAGQLAGCARAVHEDIEPWRSATDPNLIVQFCSAATRLSAGGTVAPQYVVLLQPLAASGDELSAFARDDLAPVPPYAPKPPRGLQVPARRYVLPSPNGASADAPATIG